VKKTHLFAVNAAGIDSEKVKGDFEIHFFPQAKASGNSKTSTLWTDAK